MDLVLSLVVQQNRPFNSGNLADALQKDNVKKAQVQRYLDQLVTDGKIKMRECGKSKVYFAIQPEAVLSKEKITEMERSKIALEELLIEKKQEELKNKQMLQEQKKQISVKEIREQTVQLQRTNGELQKKLQPIK
jgi:26S proteasome regulatory subunit, ATPase 3, interacting protein